MIVLTPTVLEARGVRLEPMTLDHEEELAEAARDGELSKLFFTFVPEPDEVRAYIEAALQGQADGHMLPWVVRDLESGEVAGTTRYHDVLPAVDRVEIGYTWYRPRWHRTHMNTTCKMMLLAHAFDTVGCTVVGLRTDGLNLRSQRAIEGIGAKKDGIIRRHGLRRDGSYRDDVMYSILAEEWPGVRQHLETRLWRNQG